MSKKVFYNIPDVGEVLAHEGEDAGTVICNVRRLVAEGKRKADIEERVTDDEIT